MSRKRITKHSHWKFLLAQLRARLISPWVHPLFTIYFFLVMLLLGGMGIWVPIYQNCGKEVSKAELLAVPYGIATYLIAVVASAFADVLLTDKERPSLRLFAFSVSAIALISGIIALFCTDVNKAYWLSVFGAALSLVLWCIVNAENARLQEPPPPTASTGGDPTKNLAGTLDGIDA